MNESRTELETQMIDELVAGELTGEQYRRAIRFLESNPEQWKECALAFLEEQALTRDLSCLAQTNPQWGNQQGSESEDPQEAAANEQIVQLAAPNEEDLESQRQRQKSHHRLQWMHRLTSLAAMLLISFTIGWFGGGLQGNKTTGSGEVVTSNVAGVPSPPAQRSDVSPSMTNFDPKNFQFASDEVVPIQTQIPSSLLELQRRGRIEIESFHALMPISLEDGSTAIVPVQRYRVKPVVHSY